ALAINFEPHLEVLRIGNFVPGYEPGADRTEGVAAFALVPLPAAFGLKMALADVVANAIAGDIVHRVGLIDVAGLLADDHRELAFPVRLDRVLGNDHVVVRADDGAGRLHEDDRLFGDLGAGLGGMVGIVETDADELADLADAGADPLVRAQLRQAGGVDRPDFREALVGQGSTGKVGDDAAEVADGAVRGKNGGLFGALGTHAQQFHWVSPCSSPRP